MRFIVSMLFSIMIFNYHVFGGDLDTKSLVGKWKVSGGKGQKLQVMFNLEQDSLVLSVKIKGKWNISVPKYYSVPVISNSNEIRFESNKIIDYDTTEVREYDTYHYTYFLKLTPIKKNMYSMEIGSSQLPVQVNDIVPYTRPIVRSEFSIISK
jgi:hypothetical protein